MNETIDKLAIEIDSEAGSATKGIDKLISKLTSLQNSVQKSVTNIEKLAKSMRKIEQYRDKNIKVNVTTVQKTAVQGAAKAASKQTTDAATSNLPANIDKPTGDFKQDKMGGGTNVNVNTGKSVSELQKLKQAVNDVLATLRKAQQEAGGLGVSTSKSVEIMGTKYTINGRKAADGVEKINVAVKKTAQHKSLLNEVGSALGTLGNAALKASGKVASLAGKMGKGLFSGMVGGIKNGINMFNKLGNKVKSVEGGLIKSFNNISKKIGMVSIALLGVRGVFTATRKAVSEYMNYDTQLADTLKNNWAVLGSLIAPVLEYIINLFSKAVAYINAFVKALFGVDLVAKANAKALNKAGSAAKKTAKEYGNLAKFDDLNVIDFGKDSGSGSGSDLKPLTVEDVDTSPIDRFIEYLKSKDFYGMGMEISRKFNDGLRMIDFDWLTEKAAEWGKNFGDFFNGLTDGLDWDLLGEKISGGLNTVMAFVNTFYDTYNFDHLGSGLARGMNSMVDTVNWAGIGQFFANKIQAIIQTGIAFVNGFNFANLGKGLATGVTAWFSSIDWAGGVNALIDGFLGAIETLQAFINEIDWSEVGKSLSDTLINIFSHFSEKLAEIDWQQMGKDVKKAFVDFVKSVDWANVAESLFKALGAAIGAAVSFIWGVIEDAVHSIGDYLSSFIQDGDDFFDAGGHIIAGVCEGIVNAVSKIASWIKEHIFKPFIEGFKSVFQIHSPSKVMMEMGGYIIDGFKDGVKGIWNKVKEIFTDLKTNIIGKFSEAWTGVKEAFNIENVKSFFTNVLNGIKNVFSSVATFFKTIFTNAWTAVKNVFSTGGQIFSGIKEGIENTFKAIVNKLIDGINTVVSLPFKAINKMLNKIRNVKVLDFKPFENLWGENPISIPEIPKLATGTNKIEYEGLYHLHQGEAVVPKKYNPAVNNQAYDENNARVIDKLTQLINVVENIETTNIVNIGNREVHKGTQSYIKRQNNIYGTSTI